MARRLLTAATALMAAAFVFAVFDARSEEQECEREGYSECTAAALGAVGAAFLGILLLLLLALTLVVRLRVRRCR